MKVPQLFASLCFCSTSAQAQGFFNNYFANPPLPGAYGEYSQNPVYSWGEQVVLEWHSDWTNVFVSLLQVDGVYWTVAANLTQVPGLHTYPYNATYPADLLALSSPPVFYFRISNYADLTMGFTSHFFNLTNFPEAVTDPTPSTSSLSPPTSTSVPSTTTTIVSTPTAEAARPLQPSHEAQQDTKNDSPSAWAIAGIVMGVLAAIFILIIGGGLWIHRRRKRHDSCATSSTEQRSSWRIKEELPGSSVESVAPAQRPWSLTYRNQQEDQKKAFAVEMYHTPKF